MKKFTRTALIALVLACCAAPALADGPLVQVGTGPIYVDSSGNLYFCSPGGTNCIPLTTSEDPIEP
ncbi:hypothetical protein [Arenimonas sp. MALMAid1274]|uniref:hypothetical protein n=1 Tax=Arenimonas sp. MALMAid1274 TaxID=3411630 RepID=UPI003B9FB223